MTVLGGRPAGLTSLSLDDELDTRARLVVVGNGMAGARLVEEVLERGGARSSRSPSSGRGPTGTSTRAFPSRCWPGGSSRAATPPTSTARPPATASHIGPAARGGTKE